MATWNRRTRGGTTTTATSSASSIVTILLTMLLLSSLTRSTSSKSVAPANEAQSAYDGTTSTPARSAASFLRYRKLLSEWSVASVDRDTLRLSARVSESASMDLEFHPVVANVSLTPFYRAATVVSCSSARGGHPRGSGRRRLARGNASPVFSRVEQVPDGNGGQLLLLLDESTGDLVLFEPRTLRTSVLHMVHPVLDFAVLRTDTLGRDQQRPDQQYVPSKETRYRRTSSPPVLHLFYLTRNSHMISALFVRTFRSWLEPKAACVDPPRRIENFIASPLMDSRFHVDLSSLTIHVVQRIASRSYIVELRFDTLTAMLRGKHGTRSLQSLDSPLRPGCRALRLWAFHGLADPINDVSHSVPLLVPRDVHPSSDRTPPGCLILRLSCPVETSVSKASTLVANGTASPSGVTLDARVVSLLRIKRHEETTGGVTWTRKIDSTISSSRTSGLDHRIVASTPLAVARLRRPPTFDAFTTAANVTNITEFAMHVTFDGQLLLAPLSPRLGFAPLLGPQSAIVVSDGLGTRPRVADMTVRFDRLVAQDPRAAFWFVVGSLRPGSLEPVEPGSLNDRPSANFDDVSPEANINIADGANVRLRSDLTANDNFLVRRIDQLVSSFTLGNSDLQRVPIVSGDEARLHRDGNDQQELSPDRQDSLPPVGQDYVLGRLANSFRSLHDQIDRLRAANDRLSVALIVLCCALAFCVSSTSALAALLFVRRRWLLRRRLGRHLFQPEASSLSDDDDTTNTTIAPVASSAKSDDRDSGDGQFHRYSTVSLGDTLFPGHELVELRTTERSIVL